MAAPADEPYESEEEESVPAVAAVASRLFPDPARHGSPAQKRGGAAGGAARYAGAQSYLKAAHAAQSAVSARAAALAASHPPGSAGAAAAGTVATPASFHPLADGIIVNADLERVPPQDASGVPNVRVKDSDPFGRDWLRDEINRLAQFYLQPYVKFADMVAGFKNDSLTNMVDESFTKAMGLTSLLTMPGASFDAIKNAETSRMKPAPLTVPANGSSSGAGTGTRTAPSGSDAPGIAAPQAVRSAIPMTSESEALTYLLQLRFDKNQDKASPAITKEDMEIVRRLFQRRTEHTIAHLMKPQHLGTMILNGRMRAAIAKGYSLLAYEWRPDLRPALSFDALIITEPTCSYFAELVASNMSDAMYYGGQARLPLHVKRNNERRQTLLRYRASRLRHLPQDDVFIFDAPMERADMVDFDSMYATGQVT
jgi:hypothetical protein